MRVYLAILLALVGAVFCAVSALDLTTAFCTTAGCALFKGASIAGLSLYWIGAAGFFTLAALYSASRRQPLIRLAADGCLAVGLVFDAVLLVILALTAPCLTCLVVAALLGGVALAAWAGRESALRLRRVLIIWALCFTAAVSGLGRGAVAPMPLAQLEDPALQLYFSPTCPECRTAVLRLLVQPELLRQTAFLPIAKTPEDERRLLALRLGQQHGTALPELLRALVDDTPAPESRAGIRETLAIWWMSMRNKVAVLRAGSQTVPFLQATAPGIMQLLAQPHVSTGSGPATTPMSGAGSVPQQSGPTLPGLALPGLLQSLPANQSQGCGFADQTPCD
ncbi:hypothetical protein [Megalodesulfovibrio paquesii]